MLTDIVIHIRVDIGGLLGYAELQIPAKVEFFADAADVGKHVAKKLGQGFEFCEITLPTPSDLL